MSRFFSVSLVIDYDYYVAVYRNVTFNICYAGLGQLPGKLYVKTSIAIAAGKKIRAGFQRQFQDGDHRNAWDFRQVE